MLFSTQNFAKVYFVIWHFRGKFMFEIFRLFSRFENEFLNFHLLPRCLAYTNCVRCISFIRMQLLILSTMCMTLFNDFFLYIGRFPYLNVWSVGHFDFLSINYDINVYCVPLCRYSLSIFLRIMLNLTKKSKSLCGCDNEWLWVYVAFFCFVSLPFFVIFCNNDTLLVAL